MFSLKEECWIPSVSLEAPPTSLRCPMKVFMLFQQLLTSDLPLDQSCHMADVRKHMTEEDGRSEVVTALLPGKRVDSARDVFLYLIRFFPSDHMKTLNMTSSALF